MSLVTPQLSLTAELAATATQLSQQQKDRIRDEALERLRVVDPILPHVLEVRLVRNKRRNFINLRIKPDYVTMLFQFPGSDGVRYCFLLSDKLEPFIIIVAVSPQYGKLRRLQPHHIEDLHTAIVAFKDRYGVLNESYHYTPLDDREEADSLAASGQLSYSSKAHSTHFHLKIRVATGMYKERFPVLQLVDFDKLRECTDHVKYNYRRETVSWAEVKAMMERDVLPA